MNQQIHRNGAGHSTRAFSARTPTPAKGAGVVAAQLAAWLALAGCATEDVAYRPVIVDEKPARPNHVLIYDFAASTADVSADAPVGARLSSAGSLSPRQVAMDRQLGSNMAAQVVTAVREMGLPAERALPGATPQVGDLVIRGYLASVYQGTNASGAPRFTIGFDLRAAELAAVVESFQITSRGLGRQLDFSASTPVGNAAPGAGAGANTVSASSIPPTFIVTSRMKIDGEESYYTKAESWARQSVKEITDRLKTTFQEQGWVN